jgi:hypothetical protein
MDCDFPNEIRETRRKSDAVFGIISPLSLLERGDEVTRL